MNLWQTESLAWVAYVGIAIKVETWWASWSLCRHPDVADQCRLPVMRWDFLRWGTPPMVEESWPARKLKVTQCNNQKKRRKLHRIFLNNHNQHVYGAINGVQQDQNGQGIQGLMEKRTRKRGGEIWLGLSAVTLPCSYNHWTMSGHMDVVWVAHHLAP